MENIEKKKKADLYSRFYEIKKQNSDFYSEYKKSLRNRHLQKYIKESSGINKKKDKFRYNLLSK
jgi:sulfur relay (sulfurtransferase) DsrC/TusE family protein